MEESKEILSKVKVAVRVRPPVPSEILPNGIYHSCVEVGPSTEKGQTIFVSPSADPILHQHGSIPNKVSRYTFDHVFSPSSTQEEIYSTLSNTSVDNVIRGYNTTILAYGQTGSGKTFTILGGENEKEGLAVRAIRHLLNEEDYSISMAVLQIYKEQVYDLLGTTFAEGLNLRQTQNGVDIVGLTQKRISSVKESLKFLGKAESRRAVSGTMLNDVSSRSHMILTLTVKARDGTCAKLNLVDLAGSERLKDSQAEGERLQETRAINSSLFALVSVVEALSQRADYIPYRNSKLTWVLSESLGGNSFTTVLAMVSPSQQFNMETKSTLKFAHSCKKIEHVIVQNSLATVKGNTNKLRPTVTAFPWHGFEVTITSERIRTPLGEIMCHHSGNPDGFTILLLHSCPSSFQEFRHFLAGLAFNEFRIIGVDQPGYGGSPGKRFPSRSERATDKGGPVEVLSAVIKHYGVKYLDIIGYDWGGGIGISFAVLFPKLVRKLVLFLPNFREIPDIRVRFLQCEVFILWVKEDQNHSWKAFKHIANKIPDFQAEMIHFGDRRKDANVNCYEKIGDRVMRPIIEFLTGTCIDYNPLFKPIERETESTNGDKVVEVCNINFSNSLTSEEIKAILNVPNPEVNAVRLFESMAFRHGIRALYRASENPSDKLHRSVNSVFNCLPELSPQLLDKEETYLYDIGIWSSMPKNLESMKTSPRYFPGREVLVKLQDESDLDFDNEPTQGGKDTGITKIATVIRASESEMTISLDPYEDLIADKAFRIETEQVVELNQPHVFSFHPDNRLLLEDGLICDYKSKIVKAKMLEICFEISPLIEKLDFNSSDVEVVQKEILAKIRKCLNISTFLGGFDRSRISRTDCVGKLAVNGQGNCQTVACTLTAFLLPLSDLLGIDLKYRGCFTFSSSGNNSIERHQCIEVSLRPGCRNYVVDLWKAEELNNPSWFCMDVNIAYNRFMYPNGSLNLNTKPKPLTATDIKTSEESELDEDETDSENENRKEEHEELSSINSLDENEMKMFKDDKNDSEEEENWDEETLSMDSAPTYSL
ncbi:uncharacterized protein LOC111706884 isoform X2 [Eurytemora carolleeae]|uniref:uncharacterized protein LOC111706884 isoform X2 n=1 Tax=Eurytemora carolleeae TaxID=1294199 RepID=UPI000C789B01|nr:uncharacterized protein LOC111706884 isoform X2 [Eurytemora carolleeae]|eukprot:XP_023335596.1 uncharacterized protein LOC111706884 isoform X2 [Eurytemora affinis]